MDETNPKLSSPNTVCKTCNKQFANASSLKRHKRIHINTRIYCSECHKAFLTKTRLIKHFRVVHFGKKKFKCKTCGRRYAYLHSLKKHKCENAVAGKSKIGNETFSNDDVSSPKPRKIFNCSFCDKAFVYKHVLVRHMLLHSKKQFICCSCDMHFFREDVLVNHIRVMHEPGQKFVCSECDKSFAYKHTLINHQRKHTGEKPFGCTYCGKKFSRKDHLSCHELRHTIERKIYICAYCHAVLNDKDCLQDHINEHLKSINSPQSKNIGALKISNCAESKHRSRNKSGNGSAHASSEMEKSKRHFEGVLNGVVDSERNIHPENETDNLEEYTGVSKSAFNDAAQQCTRTLTLKLKRLLECSICKQMFLDRNILESHMNMHSENHCYLCGMMFSCQDHVTSHIELLHSNYLKLRSHVRDLIDSSEQPTIEYHKELHEEKTSECDKLQKKDSQDARNVRKPKHSRYKEYFCDHCNFVGEDKISFTNHISKHVKAMRAKKLEIDHSKYRLGDRDVESKHGTESRYFLRDRVSGFRVGI